MREKSERARGARGMSGAAAAALASRTRAADSQTASVIVTCMRSTLQVYGL